MVLCTMPYKIVAHGISDQGLVRQNNEDVWAEVPPRFYVLADGMGGHQAGEIASREAADFLCAYVKKVFHEEGPPLNLREAHDLTRKGIQEANKAVYKLSKANHELRGMGTTLCCLYFHDKGVVYAHVGDSRIYRLRDSYLEQLTQDHSLLCELLGMGQLEERQSTDFMYKNIITKAVGTEAHVDPSVHVAEVAVGDIFLMCSDGLSDLLAKKDIEAILNKNINVKKAAAQLVALAKERGGHDNITVVIAKVEPGLGS